MKGRTVGDNNRLRKLVHAKLVDEGWADRVNERRWRLLVPPAGAEAAPVPLDDADGHGTQVEDVPAEAVSDKAGVLALGSLVWSAWMILPSAAREATRTPGVYVARLAGQIVYVGMAGERRGQGVRGSLSIYARGGGAVSGLGEAALDRALVDPKWVAGRLDLLHQEDSARAKEWAAAAFDR